MSWKGVEEKEEDQTDSLLQHIEIHISLSLSSSTLLSLGCKSATQLKVVIDGRAEGEKMVTNTIFTQSHYYGNMRFMIPNAFESG